MSKRYYAKQKAAAEGMLDVGLMIANASQLKAVIDAGSAHKYFLLLVVLISICLFVQLCVGFLILYLGLTENDEEENQRCEQINIIIVGLIFIVTVLNIFIGGFGISSPRHSYDSSPDG